MVMLSSPSGPLEGSVKAPPSKSITHRAIVLALLSAGKTTIGNALLSGDTLSTLEAAGHMGATFSRGKKLTVRSSLHQATDVINANNSGTTARLMSSIAALLPGHAVITGDSSLRRRPMEPIIKAVRQLGGKAFSTTGTGFLPAVFGGRMNRERATLPADISSQFASSLAISCPMKDNDTTIRLTGKLQSLAYLRLTLQMVSMFGCRSELDGNEIHCSGGGSYSGRQITIPGDYSSASFMLAAAAVTGGTVEASGLDETLIQADSRIVDIISSFGASVRRRTGSVSVQSAELTSADVDCTESPDLFPVVCVLAAGAKGRSVIRGSLNLRFKETDRVKTTCGMLRGLGVKFSVRGEQITVAGGTIRGGMVESHGDHRIAMAACVAGLASEKGCAVSEGESYAVSYPSFMEDIRSLGGKVRLT